MKGFFVYLFFISIIASTGCAPKQEASALRNLAEGLDALERGEYGRAMKACGKAVEAGQSQRTEALECLLVATVHLAEWKAALESAEKLYLSAPHNLWYQVLYSSLRSRTDSSAEISLAASDDNTAWVCLSSNCTPPANELAEAGHLAPGLAGALLLGRDTLFSQAVSHLGKPSPESEEYLFQLLAFLADDQHTRLCRHLLEIPCNKLQTDTPAVRIARTIRCRDFFSRSGCENLFEEKSVNGVVSSIPVEEKALLFARGVEHLRAGHLEEATLFLERAAARKPQGSPLPDIYLYLTYLLSDNMDKARVVYTRLVPRIPDEWSGWLQELAPGPVR
jgi:tetratricopeptide (TPR) repeat protein